MSQVFARDLIKNPPGDDTYPTIINIGSLSGKIGQSNYAVSKAGLVGLTKSLAIELSNFNIRANVVVPGFVNTEMTNKIPEKIHNYIISETPLNKMCEASDIADAVTYLSSKHSKFITGAVIEVTGGLRM
jgi:3-oxoacyl-[acyl-carrier protein] reductase